MIKITKVRHLTDCRLRVWFSDGMAGDHDFSSLVSESGPMIEPLRDRAFFARAFVESGALAWPNGFDIAPAWLYDVMAAEGTLKTAAAA
jgi:hypothetical protein